MKNAVVTGASRGIGRAIAIELGKKGYRVLVNYNNSESEAQKTAEYVEKAGGSAVIMKASVAEYQEVSRMLKDFCARYGKIQSLILNAGIYIRRDVHSMNIEEWNRTMAVNLNGAFYPVHAALNCLEENASIVFISSQLAFRGSASSVAYGASKAGILGLMRSLAIQLAPRTRVNAVSPGTIDTDIISTYTPEQREKREKAIPMGRIGAPEEVARVVAFLISEDASYITGANIDVNGGLYIH